MISESKLDEAIQFLAQTDEEAAELKVEVERKRYIIDLARSRKLLERSEGTIPERKAWVELTQDVMDAHEEMFAATLEWLKLQNRRVKAELVVNVWRTQEASRRVNI